MTSFIKYLGATVISLLRKRTKPFSLYSEEILLPFMAEIFFLLCGINFSVFQIKTPVFKHSWHLEKMKHEGKRIYEFC